MLLSRLLILPMIMAGTMMPRHVVTCMTEILYLLILNCRHGHKYLEIMHRGNTEIKQIPCLRRDMQKDL